MGVFVTTRLLELHQWVRGQLWNWSTVSNGTLTVATLAIVFPVLLALFSVFFSTEIKNDYGRKIRELPVDARVMKFAASSELSEKGLALAGNDPYLIRNGQARELVITRPDHLREFYKDDVKHHPKPASLNMGEYFARMLGDAVGAVAGDRWSIIRQYFDPAFSFQSSRQSVPQFTGGILQWVEQLPLQGTTTESGFTLDIKKPCRLLPFQLVARHVYGEVYSDKLFSDLVDINTLHETILHDVILNTRLASKLWSWFQKGANRRMEEFNARWEAFNLGIVAHARKHNLHCFAEQIYRGVDKNELKASEFLHTFNEILFANVDVSSAVLNTLFVHLAANPILQQALRAEFKMEKSRSTFELSKYLSRTDSLVSYVVMESMRFSPAFKFSLPECTAVPKVIGGYHIPARTAVVIDSGRLNSDSVTWGTDWAEFRPERFKEIPAGKCRYGFMRFGAGAASGRCLGKNVADEIFKLTVMAVLERFSLYAEAGNMEGQIEFRAYGA